MSKFRKMMLRAGLAAVALGIAGSANAAQFLITYKGIIFGNASQSLDRTGYFGLGANSSLSGQAFTAVVTLTDPQLGATSVKNTRSGQTLSGFTSGGTRDGSTSHSPVTSTLTINGRTLSFGQTDYFGQIAITANSFNGTRDSYNYFNTDSFNNNIRSLSSNIRIRINSFILDFLHTGDYTEPFSYNGLLSGNLDSSTISDFRYQDVINPTLSTSVTRIDVQAGFLIRSATLAPFVAPPVGGVPEPASWALMLGGFALTGGALRGARRRGFVKPVLA